MNDFYQFRVYRNLIAVLIVILCLGLMMVLAGCQTSSYAFEHHEGPDTWTKISGTMPPKDFKGLDFGFADMYLKAGDATTVDDPWAETMNNMINNTLPILLCASNPALCPVGVAAGLGVAGGAAAGAEQ